MRGVRKPVKILSDSLIGRLFPVTDEMVSKFWDGKDFGRKINKICALSIEYEAEIDHYNNQNEVDALLFILGRLALAYSRTNPELERLVQNVIKGIKKGISK